MSESNPFAAPSSAGSGPAPIDGFEPASSWTRLFAYLIDSFIALALIFGLAVVVLGAVYVVSVDAFDSLLAEENPLVDLTSRIIGVVAPALYGAAFEASSWMGTPGKRLLGLVVVDRDHAPLDMSQALQRNFLKSVALSCCGLLALTAIDGRPGVWNDSSGFKVVRRP